MRDSPLDRGDGLGRFAFIWSGQLASQIGTVMTSLALAFWAFEVTGRATELGLVMFFTAFPRMALGPFIGLLVDRWNRKRVLIVCDLLAGLGTITLLALHLTDNLSIWHLYALTFLTSLFAAFQTPSFTAVATVMLPKRHYGRSGGMLTLFRRGSSLIGPPIAGLLYPIIGLKGILLVDVATFLFATGSLALIRIPEAGRTADAIGRSFRQLKAELMEGLQFLSRNRSVLYFNLVFGLANMFGVHYSTLIRPMVLLRTGGSESALASILTMTGLGGVLGAFTVAAWGGAKRKFPVIFAAYAIGFLAQGLSGLRFPIISLAACGFVYALTHGVGEAHTIALHQAKIPPQLQGRVFSVIGAINRSLTLITTAVAGPLTDAVFEPAMQGSGALSRIFRSLVGTGPGSGAGLMVFLGGLACVSIFILGFSRPSVRRIETLVPDHDLGARKGRSPMKTAPIDALQRRARPPHPDETGVAASEGGPAWVRSDKLERRQSGKAETRTKRHRSEPSRDGLLGDRRSLGHDPRGRTVHGGVGASRRPRVRPRHSGRPRCRHHAL